MTFSIQPTLENERALLAPLVAGDFETLYQAASDPGIWEQHPNPDRWKRDVFQTYFEGALQSKGAFKIIDKETGKVVGCTRFYDYNPDEKSIFIGYTFYCRDCWGTGLNLSVKMMMLAYIFQYVDTVLFHIGAGNIRSQIAISRLGVQKIGEEEVTYFGEASRLNFVYAIRKGDLPDL